MKKLIGITFLFTLAIIFYSCEKEEHINADLSQDDLFALVSDEILSDINFAELLDEGDDGMFWGDDAFWTKSAEEEGNCPYKTPVNEKNKRIVTLEFLGEDCPKSGTITIEYLKPNDKDAARKKTITYSELTNGGGTTFNGTKEIVRGNNNHNIKGAITTNFSKEEKEIEITRNYHRQVHWICGKETRKDKSDNIKRVNGETEVTKHVVEGETTTTKSYTRKILNPLLVVNNPECSLRIQAGKVKITKADGSEVIINYGKMPKGVNCDFDSCNNVIEVTKDGETFEVMVEIDGDKKVRTKVNKK